MENIMITVRKLRLVPIAAKDIELNNGNKKEDRIIYHSIILVLYRLYSI